MFLPFRKTLLQVKCPFSQGKTLNIGKAVADTNLCTCSCQLFLFNFKKCDFVVWATMWLHITDVERHDQFRTKVLRILQNLCIQNILRTFSQGKLKT